MIRRLKATAWICVLAPLLLASCRLFYPDVTDPLASALPETYTLSDTGAHTPTNWWEAFENEELNDMVTTAIAGNLDLKQSWARLRQADALAAQARGQRVPELALTAEAGTSRRRTGTGADADVISVDTYSLGLAASYEVDLWGRVRATAQTARSAARASRKDVETAAMTLVGQVADRWLQAVEAEARVRLIRQQIETNERALQLLRMRAVKAGTPLLDVYQQEQVLRASQALLPEARLQAEVLRNELALLCGQPIGTVGPPVTRRLPEPLPLPGTGLPAALLMQRPDLRAQWLRVEAAAWDVASARADRMPALRLTGSAAYDSDALEDLFDDWLANLAAGLTAPVLDGRRRRAEVTRTRAVLDERLAAYRQSALSAFVEVDNAILSMHRLQEQLDSVRAQIGSASQTLAEARRRYRKGAITYLPVLTALGSVEQLQRSELAVHRQLLSARVALYRSLGGGWTAQAADRNAGAARHTEPSPAGGANTGPSTAVGHDASIAKPTPGQHEQPKEPVP